MRLLLPTASALVIAAMALSVTASGHPAAAPSSSSGSALVSPAQLSTVTATGVNTVSTGTTRIAPSDGFTWPLSPRPAVSRRFEQPRDQWSRGHRGVDLLATVGQPVLSAGGGVVAFSGVIAGQGVIAIRHAGGLRTTYEPVDERLTSGTLVHQGARIGMVSPAAGHCVPRTCLHWGAISGAAYRDPLSLLGFGRPILLPLG